MATLEGKKRSLNVKSGWATILVILNTPVNESDQIRD